MRRTEKARVDAEPIPESRTGHGQRRGDPGSHPAPFAESPRALAQRRRIEGIQGSPRLVAQRHPRPGDDQIVQVVGAGTAEKGSCDDALRGAFGALRQARDLAIPPDGLGTVVLWWMVGDEPDGHTAVLVTWGNAQYVVDTSIGQFTGAPSVFVGTVEEWKARILEYAREDAGDKGVSEPLLECSAGLRFTSGTAFWNQQDLYFQGTAPGREAVRRLEAREREREALRQQHALQEEWEAGAVPIAPRRGWRPRWRFWR